MSVVTHLLNKRALVTRNTAPQTNGEGGFTPGPTTIFAALPVRLSPKGTNERLRGDQRFGDATDLIVTEADVVLYPQDVALIDGRTFRLMGSTPPSKPYFNEWMAQELQLGGS